MVFTGKKSAVLLRIMVEYEKAEQLMPDAQAKRGNSGGPVLDARNGLIVGVLTGSILSRDERLTEEINKAIPARYVWALVAQ